MARYHGKVGFLTYEDDQETGMCDPVATEKSFYGTVLEHTRRWDSIPEKNDGLSLSNQIAITATDWAFRHASAIAYAEYMGQMWKVTSMRVKHPQIILTLGGVWNGPTAGASS